jgi:hypothetical protein
MRKNSLYYAVWLCLGTVGTLNTVDIIILKKIPNAIWVTASGINVDTETPDIVNTPRDTVHINSTYVTSIKVTDSVTGARDVWIGNSDGMGVAWEVTACNKPCRSRKGKKHTRKLQPCPDGICVRQVDLPK